MIRKTLDKKLRLSVPLLLLTIILGITVWNLDFVLALARAYQNGGLTMERIRFDIAAFDIGQAITVTLVAERASALDGMIQVYIPEGKFTMGHGDMTDGKNAPEHIVYLDAFWMDQVEVTNGMYAKCVRAGVCSLPTININPYYGRWAYRDYPVVYVTWPQADEYCQWAGRRLPTEAEWEKAARGAEGNIYPWGNTPPNPRLANFDIGLRGEAISAYRYPLGASPYGVLNMAGNVREWVADWFAADYYRYSPLENPTGPSTGTERSLRSGSYNEDKKGIAVYQRYNHYPNSPGLSRGFRCAQ
jgi:formylglycine-generating enzyme required for sulfatase activity